MSDPRTGHEFEYVGNLHIHSRYSDGGGTIKEIAQSASKGGLDFIVINDHDFMTESLHLEEEGSYDGLFVFMCLEIGRRHHHYLAFGLDEMVNGGGLNPQGVIDLVNESGGFGFLAHPFEKGMPFTEKSVAYTWDDLSVIRYTGICIWNFSSRWKERIKTPLHGLFFLIFKTRTLKGPSRQTLSFWDRVCRKRRVAAIGGSDAHGSVFRWGFLRFIPLSYDHTVNSINIHVLLEKRLSRDLKEAKSQVYGAMREGRLFIAHERVASARGFTFDYTSDNGTRLLMGEEMGFEPGILSIKTPGHCRITLLRNGAFYKRRTGTAASWRVETGGVYRVEVFRTLFPFGQRPWIFSNPIYLR